MGEAETISESEAIEFDRLCESCGYNLRGLTENRCPECGTTFDPDELPVAQIPWLRRKEIGPGRAFGLTVAAIVLGPASFARNLHRPARINHVDGAKFRSSIIWIAMFASLIVPGCAMCLLAFNSFEIASVVIAVLVLVAIGGSVHLFLRLASILLLSTYPELVSLGLGTLKDYAIAPLSLWTILCCNGVALVAVLQPSVRPSSRIPEITFICIGVTGIYSWLITVRLVSVAARLSTSRAIRIGLILAFHWIAAALVSTIVLAIVITISILMTMAVAGFANK